MLEMALPTFSRLLGIDGVNWSDGSGAGYSRLRFAVSIAEERNGSKTYFQVLSAAILGSEGLPERVLVLVRQTTG